MNIKYRVGLSFFGFLFSSLTPVFSEIEEKIVGGSEISIKEVPYMLSYMVKNKHVCGAGIIDREWGVTAAHCVEPLGRDAVKVVTVRSGSDTHDKGGVVHNITKITYHEKYDDEIIDYDIAVFKVTPPFEYDETTQPLKLTSYPTSVDLEWGIVAGWGYFLTFDPVISEKLQYVWLPKVNATQCKKDYDRGYEITSHEVCYGLREGGRDACQGDSGGPLANNGTLIGITSWGDGCGKPNTPGVYADAVLLSDWVKKKAGIKN